ncbi:hypothetical protein AMQ84_00095, partial [Paenibacillus riograndensis]
MLRRHGLAMVQGSSPSCPVMASGERAGRRGNGQGAGECTAGVDAVDVLRRGLATLRRYGLLQPAATLQGACSRAGAAAAPRTQLQGKAGHCIQDASQPAAYDAAGSLPAVALRLRPDSKDVVPARGDGRHVGPSVRLGSEREE